MEDKNKAFNDELDPEIVKIREQIIKKIGNKPLDEVNEVIKKFMEVYNQGMKEFERGDVIYAGKKFSEAELLYPQSIWAPRAVLMSAYGYFSQGYYSDAIKDLENNVILATLIVFTIILIFMGWRSSMLVSMSIPFSFLMSMIILSFFDVTLAS